MKSEVIQVSTSKQFRIVRHDGIYALQKHYPNGWRDCIEGIYTENLDTAIQLLITHETTFIKNLKL